jgi:hypothetical protein
MSSTPKVRYAIIKNGGGYEGEFEFMSHNQQCWTHSLKKAKEELADLWKECYPEDDPRAMKIYKLIITEVK